MIEKKRTIVGLGELLWDLLPSGAQLGGAPANFAYITNLLGNIGIPASRVGGDALGEAAVQRLSELGLNSAFVQRDSAHPTGTVNVQVDGSGQPRFEIKESVAWDFLEWTRAWERLAREADAVCFGSLAQRSPQSRTTIKSFLNAVRPEALRVFDVNLRQHFYSQQILSDSMKLANIVKLNHEELPRIMCLLGLDHKNEEDSARTLLSIHNLQMICVTRGSCGSLLVSLEASSEHAGFAVQVVDTVGAGDAFTAAMVCGYLALTPLDEINEMANRVGAWVASQPGATPALKPGGLQVTLAEIG